MKRGYWFVLVVLFFTHCRKPFDPIILNLPQRFLVVDGFISLNPNDTTRITLTRTKNLSDTIVTIPELGANVTIESAGGSIYTLNDLHSKGIYTSGTLSLNLSDQYRLKIQTSDNHQYVSDYVNGKAASPIDSLTWQQDEDVTIFVNSHDPTNNTVYYRWDYLETWEYDSRVENFWGLDGDHIFPLDASTQMHRCWDSAYSSHIVTATSVALSEDVVNHVPVTKIIKDDVRIKVRYSINVRQIPITLEAYNYWSIIQKNSQELGTLFDLQPSQLAGNIHPITDPNEPVIGYMSAASTSTKRLFIDHSEVTDWSTLVPGRECDIKYVLTDPNDPFHYTYADPDYAPFYFTGSSPALILLVTRRECIDCRVKGGTSIKPSYWQ